MNAQTSAPPVQHQASAWAVLAVLLLFSIAAPLNQFKVPPIMPVLMDAWDLPVSRAGLLMSVFAVTGIVLALPAGLILQRAGYRVTGILAGGSLALGAVIGALSQGIGMLLLGRVVEGVGTGFVAVLVPAIVAAWFPARRRATALGIWATWVPIGQATTLLSAPALSAWAGWRSVWWAGALYAVAVTALYLAFVKPSPPGHLPIAPPSPGLVSAASNLGHSPVLRDRNVWLIGLAFAFYCAGVFAAGSFLPTYLNTARGMPLAQAARLVSITTLVSIVSVPAAGALSDRLGARKRLYLLGLLAAALVLPAYSLVSGPALGALVVAHGVFLSLVPTNIFAAAVEAAGSPRMGGLAMAVVMLGQNAGALAGPLLFGVLAGSPGGWTLAFAALPVLCMCGIVAGGLVRGR